MIKAAVTVGGHVVPAGTECYCVTRHIPSYPHCLPYELPDGRVVFVCPATYHSTKALLQLFRKAGGILDKREIKHFAIVPRRLARLHYRMETENRASDELLEAERVYRLNSRMD